MTFMEDATAAIHEAGGRFTAQRRLIVELLDEAGEHLDADKLYHLAHDRDNTISLATVYRTLNVLQEAGLLRQHYLTHGHDRKVYEPTGAEHYHFVCSSCRQIVEFETQWVEPIKLALESRYGVRVDQASIIFEGLCSACQKERGNG